MKPIVLLLMAALLLPASLGFAVVPLTMRKVDRSEVRELEKAQNSDAEEKMDKIESALAKIIINADLKPAFDELTLSTSDNFEKVNPKAELFIWLQVLTVSFHAFVYDANVDANSIGPFVSAYQLYKSNGLPQRPRNPRPSLTASSRPPGRGFC
jgi:phosphate/sulfate permease